MKIQNMKTGLRLSVSFALIIVMVIIMNLITIGYMRNISELSTRLYEHPFTVSTATLRVDGNIIRIHRSMKDVALAKNRMEMVYAVNEVNRLEQLIIKDFEIIEDRFLGDKSQIKEVRELFIKWKPIRDEVIELKFNEKDEEAAKITKGKGAIHVNTLIERIGALVSFAQNKADLFDKKAVLEYSNAQKISYLAMCLTALIAMTCAFLITRSITTPLREVVSIADKISVGNFEDTIEINQRDEIGDLANAFKNMQEAIATQAQVAQNVADGDLSSTITIRSDKDLLGKALNSMTENLRTITKDAQEEDWIKSGQTKLAEIIRGELSSKELMETALNFLCEYLNIQIGACYQEIDNSKSEEQQFKLLSSYAYTVRNNDSTVYQMGEGLVGQAALEKKTIVFTRPSDQDSPLVIETGVANIIPSSILVVPLIHEGKVNAVLEFGAAHELSGLKTTLIHRITENLAVALHSARARVKMKELLEQTQSQQERLKTANVSLKEQAERLRASEEELKQQSEELRVSNEELEEKQEMLERKNTDVERAKKDIEIKAEELRLASKYKSEFLANMSHELRTPLNSLLILSKSLADNKNENLNETEVEDARIIHEGGSDLLHLINDIMDLSKVEAGMLSVISEDVQLTSIERNLTKMFNPLAQKNNLDFTISIADDLPEYITSDGLRLEQILKNFLSNAMKFTSDGSVKLEIKRPHKAVLFGHSSLTAKGSIAFTVIDTGIGIPKDKQLAIFEAFQQQDGSTSRTYGGTGLGLTISRELSHLLEGEIQLTSEVNKGSSFTLYLPMKLDPNSVINTKAPVQEQFYTDTTSNSESVQVEPTRATRPSLEEYIPDDRNDLQGNDMTLLIIDDDQTFARILYNHCKANGFKCLVAGDGRTGLMYAKEYNPTAILLDLGLPDISGHEVLEQLKFSLQTRHIPVQVISAYDRDLNNPHIQSAMGYLTKPIEEEDLNTALHNIKTLIHSGVKKILLIEDDEASRHAIMKLIDHDDINITWVETGEEGVKEILTNYYNCIILDLGLPDMSGFEVLESIYDKENIPPVIIYTGREISDEEYKQLSKYSSDIVIKGHNSADRLLDDVTLFLHTVESKLPSESKETIHMLHNEDAMLEGRRVLLVDDDMRNTYALSKKLMELGIEVDMANNGQDAVDKLTIDNSYELILMDIMMPIMDGYEAIRHIRKMQNYRDIPIIALTAKAMPDDRRECIEAGASEYLMKPIDFDRLLSLMRVWLFKHL